MKKSYKTDYIRMLEFREQLELFNIHYDGLSHCWEDRMDMLTWAELIPELGNCHLTASELADVHILEASTTNLFKFGKFVRRNLSIFQPKGL